MQRQHAATFENIWIMLCPKLTARDHKSQCHHVRYGLGKWCIAQMRVNSRCNKFGYRLHPLNLPTSCALFLPPLRHYLSHHAVEHAPVRHLSLHCCTAFLLSFPVPVLFNCVLKLSCKCCLSGDAHLQPHQACLKQIMVAIWHYQTFQNLLSYS